MKPVPNGGVASTEAHPLGAPLGTLVWPVARLSEALEAVARQAGLVAQPSLATTNLPEHLTQVDEETLNHWLAFLASQWGLEVEPLQATYAEADPLVRGVGPALLRLPAALTGGEVCFFALLHGGWRQVALVGPDLAVHRVALAKVRDALCSEAETPYAPALDQLLTSVGLPEPQRRQARQLILAEQLSALPLPTCWLIRLAPSANLWRQARQARLLRPVLTLLGGYSLLQSLLIGAWWMIGRGALGDHFEWAWLLGWGLLLVTAVPCQFLVARALSRLAVGAGALFKQRLLFGALHLEPEEIRRQGAGQFLGRVLESEAVEQLGLTGGFTAGLAVIQVGVAGAVLALGVSGWLHTLLLAFWLAVILVISGLYLQRSQAWADMYRMLTNDLVERMVGHRTRLAQEAYKHWHVEEDQLLERYEQLSEQMDRIGLLLSALASRGWMIVGLAGLAYGVLRRPDASTQLAISLGGVLLALQALTTLSKGLRSLINAQNAWTQIHPLFQAAARSEKAPTLGSALLAERPTPRGDPAEERQPVILARQLDFRYQDRGAFILQGCNLQIRQGERLLLEGASGSGKSTLAAVLAGLRPPQTGLLLLWGFDRQALGSTAWRRRVVAVPQFHENHIFTGSLAFNLLMGRRWPPRPEDLRAATALCRELGLGDLLERMPAGLQQIVGENGWQLSHGERSRLYMARALLQQADLVIFDESFGSLDPENLQRTLPYVLQYAPTLLVIAHP